MCGYLIYPYKPSDVIVQLHLNRQRHRGEDGYGAISLTGDTTKTVKTMKALHRRDFLKQYKEKLPIAPVIVHHRKASIGGVKEHLVHPLMDDDETVNVMQNGTRRPLVTMFEEDSDTKVLAEYWMRVDDKAINMMLEGTGVVFVTDDSGLYFHRDKGRTLFKCVEGKMCGMYASEPVEEGMWSPVLEHQLKCLPKDMTKWDLELGKPVEYKMKTCNRANCNESFASDKKYQEKCPHCPAYVNTYAGYNSKNNRSNVVTRLPLKGAKK